ncbi:MAG: FlgD immunoglobulin-like domain containing protein [Candidatus Krumholzibacteria bacterium]|jgi:predicted GH43/DUF377 family glycosyl hydrolase|nr:FlgD immunoglobulin-like domain containing protein [Candidatus Krumholzibacteria bacterium]
MLARILFPKRPLRVFCLLTLYAGLASAGALFDFEQPYFIEEPGVQVKDHALVFHDNLYHVFYIQSFPPDSVGDWRRNEKWLGHITSPDLCHWTRQDSILHVRPGTWESDFIWAPEVIENPEGDGWILYYTGVDYFFTQYAGGAKSGDLFEWERFPENPIYHPSEWAFWIEGNQGWPWSNCRDPEIFHIPGERSYYMLNTARTADDSLGAISLARSQDLVHWQDEGPLFLNDTGYMLESAQLILDDDGLYHLFFTEQYIPGTSHMSSSSMTGNWDKDNLNIIDPGHGAEVSRVGEEWVYSRFNGVDTADSTFYYLRFDNIELETWDQVPRINLLGGLRDHWTVFFGNAFYNQPTWGDNPWQRGDARSGMEGNSYLATYENYQEPADSSTGSFQGNLPIGVLLGEPFVLDENRISLLVGGGAHPDTCFASLFDNSTGRQLFTETGQDSFAMDLRIWDTSSLVGHEVYLAIVDLHQGVWGHISVDTIREYTETGEDPLPPSLPMDNGPFFNEVIANAGYDPTGLPDLPATPGARLEAPWPNPFNPQTRITFELDAPGQVLLSIHDASGKKVRTLVDEQVSAGRQQRSWKGRDYRGQRLSSGIYLIRMQVDGQAAGSRKILMLK